ncbi:transcription termination/antitermination protein NusG [Methylobacterium thuringiense]|uniref:Transcription antitermination protein RfaH n=1 Tax=Methylobacterium thuringiense TaxID=1003091 RepID=A0ABQ4THZ1_9HYPH|nr:transcription termination/antitermination NusG family protein [Methylobacterium thuringiense]GJE54561.1 Transcription antitermination protein RfaH [Methylobacterium thuringiense]
MGAKMYGSRSGKVADNDNHKPKVDKNGEIPIPFEERRNPPVIEKAPGSGWFCLVTVPQNEYRCADSLSDHGIATYVPTNTHWEKRRKGKDLYNTELQSPLFRGYVFAHLSSPEWRDGPLGRYPTLKPDWSPVFERDAWGQSAVGILRILGSRGVPAPMPLRIQTADNKPGGLIPLADDEREGWFDDRKRPALVAYHEKCEAEIERLKAMKPIAAGERISVLSGIFAGRETIAVNDNEKNKVRVMTEVMGAMRLVELALSDVENLDRPMRPENIALRRA